MSILTVETNFKSFYIVKCAKNDCVNNEIKLGIHETDDIPKYQIKNLPF